MRMPKFIEIAIGSTSEHKIGAVQDAVDMLGIKAEIIPIKAPSAVNEQPKDLIETRYGASARATFAWKHPHALKATIAIGIESGIMPTVDPVRYDKKQQYIDCAIVSLVSFLDEEIVTMASGHMVNRNDVEEAERRGFRKHTVSSVTKERTGCDETDSMPRYTGGKATRREQLANAVKNALLQYFQEAFNEPCLDIEPTLRDALERKTKL